MQATLAHAAQILHVHRATVGRAVTRGELTGVWAASGRLVGVEIDDRFRAWTAHPGAERPGTRGQQPDPWTITLRQAAAQRGCSHTAIRAAIQRGALSGVWAARADGTERCVGVRVDALFGAWTPRRKFDRFGERE